jgi:hypothetical protein
MTRVLTLWLALCVVTPITASASFWSEASVAPETFGGSDEVPQGTVVEPIQEEDGEDERVVPQSGPSRSVHVRAPLATACEQLAGTADAHVHAQVRSHGPRGPPQAHTGLFASRSPLS